MKKLEKLNQSKFKAFKGEKISDLAKFVGGVPQDTWYDRTDGTHGKDVWDKATTDCKYGYNWQSHCTDYAEVAGTVAQGSTHLGVVTNSTTGVSDDVYTAA